MGNICIGPWANFPPIYGPHLQDIEVADWVEPIDIVENIEKIEVVDPIEPKDIVENIEKIEVVDG